MLNNFEDEYFNPANYLYNKSKLYYEHCLYFMNYKENDFEKESKDFSSVLSTAKNEYEVQ